MRPSRPAVVGATASGASWALWGVLGLAMTVALSGCSGNTADDWKRGGLPQGASDTAARTTTLWQGAWVAALIVGAVVWGLILAAVVLYRRRPGDTGLPPQVRYNLPVEVLYTSLPLLIVGVYFFYTARDEFTIDKVGTSQVHIDVVAKQWSWDFSYTDPNAGVYETGTPKNPPTLWLPVNEKVEFTVESRDVDHSFWVPALMYKRDTIPGLINRFSTTPNRIGTYPGRCAEFCGLNHSRMLFTLKIVSRADYDAHIAALKAANQVGKLDTAGGRLEPGDTSLNETGKTP